MSLPSKIASDLHFSITCERRRGVPSRNVTNLLLGLSILDYAIFGDFTLL